MEAVDQMLLVKLAEVVAVLAQSVVTGLQAQEVMAGQVYLTISPDRLCSTLVVVVVG
jgi:hypothetical protein